VKGVVTAEEHNIIGGLGSAVTEVLAARFPVLVIRHGVNDSFGRSGSAQKVLEHYNLTPDGIIEKVREAIARKGRGESLKA
jgi:transketolase